LNNWHGRNAQTISRWRTARHGAPMTTAHAMSSIHAGRISMTAQSTVTGSLRRYSRRTRNCTRRYTIRFIKWSMHRGSRTKTLRQPNQQRNAVHHAANRSHPTATASGIARRVGRSIRNAETQRVSGEPTTKTKTSRFRTSETFINQRFAGFKMKTPYSTSAAYF